MLCLQFCTAQDLFGADEDEPAEIPETATRAAGEPDAKATDSGFSINTEKNAVVRSLRSRPPKSYADLAKAVQLMARIHRWGEVQFWLDRIVASGINEVGAQEMVESVGSQTFVSLLRPDADISEKQRESVRGLLELASKSSRDPKKLSAAVEALRSNTKSVRIQGFRDLQGGGDRGVAVFLESFLNEQSDAPNATMSEAFMLLRATAFGAWKAAMASSDPAARGRLVLLAAPIGESSLTIELCCAAHDQQLPPAVRQELERLASSHGNTLPSAERIHRHAIDAMQGELLDYQRVRWSDETDAYSTWQLANDGKTIVQVPARNADLYWQKATSLARSALRAGQSIDRFSAKAFAVLLEDSNLDASDLWTPELLFQSMPTGIQDSEEFACLLWDAAVTEQLSAAQLLAVRNLARWGSKDDIPSPVRQRLVQACSSGFAAVRYEAAATLVKSRYSTTSSDDSPSELNDQSFNGRSKLDRLLAEMRQLDGKPLVLLIGGSSSLRSHTSTLLRQFSYRVYEVSSASQVFAAIRQGLPIESVVVVDSVREMNLGEMVQRIRANPSLSSCPIAVLADSLSSGDHRILGEDKRVIVGSVPPAVSGLADILRRMKIVEQAPRVDSMSRMGWKQLADVYWTDMQTQQTAKNPSTPFAPWAETPEAQKHLVAIVLDKSRSLPEREQASQIFVQSVKQFGLQLSSETENAQYDEYNSRGPDETDLRVMLGRILDAIEAAKGKRTWAAVAP